MKNSLASNVLKQYVVLIMGVLLSLVINFINDYNFQYSREWVKNYNYTWNSYIITVGYLIFNLYFLSFFSPLINSNKSKLHKIFFYILIIVNIAWSLAFGFEKGSIIWMIIITCAPMPLTYVMAWRINAQYWRLEEIGKSE